MNSKTASVVASWWNLELFNELTRFDVAHKSGDKIAKAQSAAKLSQMGIMMANYFTDLTEAYCIVSNGKPDGEMILSCREANKAVVDRINKGIQELGRSEVPPPTSGPKLPN